MALNACILEPMHLRACQSQTTCVPKLMGDRDRLTSDHVSLRVCVDLDYIVSRVCWFVEASTSQSTCVSLRDQLESITVFVPINILQFFQGTHVGKFVIYYTQFYLVYLSNLELSFIQTPGELSDESNVQHILALAVR